MLFWSQIKPLGCSLGLLMLVSLSSACSFIGSMAQWGNPPMSTTTPSECKLGVPPVAADGIGAAAMTALAIAVSADECTFSRKCMFTDMRQYAVGTAVALGAVYLASLIHGAVVRSGCESPKPAASPLRAPIAPTTPRIPPVRAPAPPTTPLVPPVPSSAPPSRSDATGSPPR